MNLSSAQRKILKATVERILPSGKYPGARETGVAAYVESALFTPYWHRVRKRVIQGLDLLDAMARSSHDIGFAEAGPEVQDTVLHQVQNIPHKTSRRFFRTMIVLSLEGFLGDPSRGGNRRMAGWRHLGYEPGEPPPGGCLREPEDPS